MAAPADHASIHDLIAHLAGLGARRVAADSSAVQDAAGEFGILRDQGQQYRSASFLREMFGTVPEDVVALLGANWLKVRRAEQLVRMVEKLKERLRARRVEALEPASLSIALLATHGATNS
jgi:hypothetical protein